MVERIEDKIEQLMNELEIKSVLIADDSSENLLAAKTDLQYLEQKGISIDYVSSEKEAIKRINEKEYNLVITDKQMEEKDSGIRVALEAEARLVDYVAIATSFVHGGYKTELISLELDPFPKTVDFSKDKEGGWKKILERLLTAYKKNKETGHSSIKFIEAKRFYKSQKKGEEIPEDLKECLYLSWKIFLDQ